MDWIKSYTLKEAISTIKNNLVMINTLNMANNKILEALEEEIDKDKSKS